MKAATVSKINSKLKNIPDTFTKDIMAYIDYLIFKSHTGDWATELSVHELKLIQRGSNDVKAGRIISHSEALKKISAHIKQKRK
jgi:predicted transcriptional regulator